MGGGFRPRAYVFFPSGVWGPEVVFSPHSAGLLLRANDNIFMDEAFPRKSGEGGTDMRSGDESGILRGKKWKKFDRSYFYAGSVW